MQEIDKIDRALIRALRRNARLTNVALAEEVGLSPSACLRRVNLLEQAGVIRGYTALIGGAEAEGRQVVIVRISLVRQSEEIISAFEAEVVKHPEIRSCYLMTGDEDYLMRLEAEAPGDYERIHKEILCRLPGVAKINSGFAIRTVI